MPVHRVEYGTEYRRDTLHKAHQLSVGHGWDRASPDAGDGYVSQCDLPLYRLRCKSPAME
jgi:hypothetical protein